MTGASPQAGAWLRRSPTKQLRSIIQRIPDRRRAWVRSEVQTTLNRFGYNIQRIRDLRPDGRPFPHDFDDIDMDLVDSVRPYTRTSKERVYSLRRAVAYVVSKEVPGAIVECGVWRGGSMMAVARTLLELRKTDRHLYLFDTFEGMISATEDDVDYLGVPASEQMKNPNDPVWCRAGLEDVRAAMQSTHYNQAMIHYVQGPVEKTVPGQAPETIALLRLDTDFYESTKHELVHLYPLLAPGGVLIIDDYGDWRGARKATDEFLRETNANILLNRIDDSGRIGVKFPAVQ